LLITCIITGGAVSIHFSLKLFLTKLKIVEEPSPETSTMAPPETMAKTVKSNDKSISKHQMLEECGCERSIEYANDEEKDFLCSSVTRGPHQNIIAFTFFEG